MTPSDLTRILPSLGNPTVTVSRQLDKPEQSLKRMVRMYLYIPTFPIAYEDRGECEVSRKHNLKELIFIYFC